MGEAVSALAHDLRPLVKHYDWVTSGYGCFLSETEATISATSAVGVGDADGLPGDGGIHPLVLLLPDVLGEGSVVPLAGVGEGGLVVVESELECDCSLADVLLVLGVGVHLGFVHQAGDLAPSLERAHPPAASTVAAGVLHVLLSLHQL